MIIITLQRKIRNFFAVAPVMASVETRLVLELSAAPLALLLGVELVGVALAAAVGEGRALAGAGVEVPVGVLLLARA